MRGLEFGGNLFQTAFVPCDENEIIAISSEQFGQFVADARRRPGNECPFAHGSGLGTIALGLKFEPRKTWRRIAFGPALHGRFLLLVSPPWHSIHFEIF